MAAIGLAAVAEAGGGEISVIARKIEIERAGQPGHVAGGRKLAPVGQAGSIAETGSIHAQGLGLGGHLAGEGDLAAGQAFRHDRGYVIGRFHDQREDRLGHADTLALAQAELGVRLAGGARRDLEAVAERYIAVLDRLEQQIQGHHLGERRRVMAVVHVFLVEHGAGIAVDDHGGRFGDQRRRQHCRHRDEHRRRQGGALEQARQVLDHPLIIPRINQSNMHDDYQIT